MPYRPLSCFLQRSPISLPFRPSRAGGGGGEGGGSGGGGDGGGVQFIQQVQKDYQLITITLTNIKYLVRLLLPTFLHTLPLTLQSCRYNFQY